MSIKHAIRSFLLTFSAKGRTSDLKGKDTSKFSFHLNVNLLYHGGRKINYFSTSMIILWYTITNCLWRIHPSSVRPGPPEGYLGASWPNLPRVTLCPPILRHLDYWQFKGYREILWVAIVTTATPDQSRLNELFGSH